MTIFTITLVIATLLCALVAGFLFAYAVVLMPGIKLLDDKAFIKAFQVTDGIIQRNQPMFILVWVGSALSLIGCALSGLVVLKGFSLFLLIAATVLYIAGVQVSTIAINLPLNRQLQQCDVERMSESELKAARERFEPRWNRANRIRAVIASITALLLIVLALKH